MSTSLVLNDVTQLQIHQNFMDHNQDSFPSHSALLLSCKNDWKRTQMLPHA